MKQIQITHKLSFMDNYSVRDSAFKNDTASQQILQKILNENVYKNQILSVALKNSFLECITQLYKNSIHSDLAIKQLFLLDNIVTDTLSFTNNDVYSEYEKLKTYFSDNSNIGIDIGIRAILSKNILAYNDNKVIPLLSDAQYKGFLKSIEYKLLSPLIKQKSITLESKVQNSINYEYILYVLATERGIHITSNKDNNIELSELPNKDSYYNDFSFASINYSKKILSYIPGEIRNTLDIIKAKYKNIVGVPQYLKNEWSKEYGTLLDDLTRCISLVKHGKGNVNIQLNGEIPISMNFDFKVPLEADTKTYFEGFIGGNGTIGYEYHQGVKKHLVGIKRYNYKKDMRDNKLANEIEVDNLD